MLSSSARLMAAVIFVLLSLAGTAGPGGAAEPSDALYLHPGRLLDVGGFRLNLVCSGAGSPAVVFDAGLEDWSPAWSKVQPVIARSTLTCSYDRAGNGLSDAGPAPRSSAQIVTELHALLGAAGVPPPYILVGHSFGGYNMRLFADRYLDEVAGIVLVDSSHEDQAALDEPADHAAMQWQHEFAALRTCRQLALARVLANDPHANQTCVAHFFRGLPERTFSTTLNAALAHEALAPKQYAASLGEAELFATTSANEVRRARRSFGATPVRILTGTHHFADGPHVTAKQIAREQRFEHGWQALQRSWLHLSTNARQILAQGSGHYVQLDRPKLVIAAIREEITLARKRK